MVLREVDVIFEILRVSSNIYKNLGEGIYFFTSSRDKNMYLIVEGLKVDQLNSLNAI